MCERRDQDISMAIAGLEEHPEIELHPDALKYLLGKVWDAGFDAAADTITKTLEEALS